MSLLNRCVSTAKRKKRSHVYDLIVSSVLSHDMRPYSLSCLYLIAHDYNCMRYGIWPYIICTIQVVDTQHWHHIFPILCYTPFPIVHQHRTPRGLQGHRSCLHSPASHHHLSTLNVRDTSRNNTGCRHVCIITIALYSYLAFART